MTEQTTAKTRETTLAFASALLRSALDEPMNATDKAIMNGETVTVPQIEEPTCSYCS